MEHNQRQESGRGGKMDPNGTTWEELQKQLFSEKEIKESEKRVKELIQQRQQENQDGQN